MERVALAALSLVVAAAAVASPGVPQATGRLAVYRLQLPHGPKAQARSGPLSKPALSGHVSGRACSGTWRPGGHDLLIVDVPLSGEVTLSAADRTGAGHVSGIVTFRGPTYSGDGWVLGEGELSGTLAFTDSAGKPLPPARVSIAVRDWEAYARSGCVEIDETF